MSVADEKFASLRAQGFTGAISDMLLQFHADRNAVTETYPDGQSEFLIVGGEAESNVNDMWFAKLRGLGYTGSLQDMFLQFWENQLLGADLVTDGVFAADLSAWTPTGFFWVDVGAPYFGVAAAIGAANIVQTIGGLTNGVTYRVRFWMSDDGGTVTVRINGGTASAGQLGVGYKSVDVVAGATGTTLQLLTTGAVALDNISCREVL